MIAICKNLSNICRNDWFAWIWWVKMESIPSCMLLTILHNCLVISTTTQKNSYSISHLHCTVTTRWLDSDGVVTVDNWQQHHGHCTVDQLCSHSAAGSYLWLKYHHCSVTVQRRSLTTKEFCWVICVILISKDIYSTNIWTQTCDTNSSPICYYVDVHLKIYLSTS